MFNLLLSIHVIFILSVVCVMYMSLHATCRLSFVVCRLCLVVCRLCLVVCGLSSVSCLLSSVSCRLSSTCRLLSFSVSPAVVYCRLTCRHQVDDKWTFFWVVVYLELCFIYKACSHVYPNFNFFPVTAFKLCYFN